VKAIKKTSLALIISCTFIVAVIIEVCGQTEPIGFGWAKNSVNAPIFRKNSVTSLNGIQFTSFYDSLGNVILANRKLGTDSWEVSKTQYTGDVTDAHRSISIAVDGNGYLHMAWDHHGHPLSYCMSTDSLSLTLGAKQSMVGTLESVVTYPEFFRMPNGDLIFIYRDGWSGNANCVINKYSISEKKWIRLQNNLISGETTRSAYWQSCVDINGVIHVSWVWRETGDVASNHDMCYARSNDGGVSWYKSTGEQYTIPITASTAEYICDIAQNSELINQTSMYATSEGKPYIASYWTDEITNRLQFQLIYQDIDLNWQQKAFSNRKSDFSLSGVGTKKIPISRPQVMVDDRGEKPAVYMLYRDNDRGSKVSVNVCFDLNADTIQILECDLTDFSVDDWEPTYDIDLWKDSQQLNVFVQRMVQGDGETLSDLPAQPVYIWSVPNNLTAIDTLYTPVIAAGKATDPTPGIGAGNISPDVILTWVTGENASSHNIYLGRSLSDLEWIAETNDNYYELKNLMPGTRYYWRINEQRGEEVTTGDTWYFNTGAVTGINHDLRSKEIRIIPQPAHELIYIDNLKRDATIEIYSLEGRKLIAEETNGIIDISSLGSGTYLLKIEDYQTLKFTK
jgi:hypothetical protein